MHLEGADLLRAKTVRGLTEISAELRDCMDVRLLRRRRQIADRHVLDHAAAKGADLSHRETSCLKGWALTPTILSDRRQPPRPSNYCRDSGFVQSTYHVKALKYDDNVPEFTPNWLALIRAPSAIFEVYLGFIE